MKTHRAQRRILVSISYLLEIPNAVDEAGYSTSKIYYSRKYWKYVLPFANYTGFLCLRPRQTSFLNTAFGHRARPPPRGDL